MSFTNINDPAGVAALLEKLRSSQAWADLQTVSSNAEQPGQTLNPEPHVPSHIPADNRCIVDEQHSSPSYPTSSTSSSAVASLLSQLQATELPFAPIQTRDDSSCSIPASAPLPEYVDSPSSYIPTPVPSRRRDLRASTFQHSLPHLARLSEDQAFVDALSKIKLEQGDIERQLWEERQAIHTSQQEKVRVAVTKANMLGTSISEREANAMTQRFQNELRKFDKERALPAWDGLIMKQQIALEALGVPSMFATNVVTDQERQKRVVQVLEGIVGTGED